MASVHNGGQVAASRPGARERRGLQDGSSVFQSSGSPVFSARACVLSVGACVVGSSTNVLGVLGLKVVGRA